MTHLVLRKLPNGKYKIFNKDTKEYEGKAMVNEDEAIEITKAKDEKEDKENEADS